MKSKLKNIGIIFLTAVMVLGLLTGCGDSGTATGSAAANSASVVSIEAEAEETDAAAGFTLVQDEEETDAGETYGVYEIEEGEPDAAAGDTEDQTDEILPEESEEDEDAIIGDSSAESSIETGIADGNAVIGGTQDAINDILPDESGNDAATDITEDGTYTSKEEVAAYIHEFGHLPSNYISKYDAEDLGWDNSQGNLWDVAPGKSIGGNKFGNYEGLLPTKKGRKYYECDIDYDGGYRNAKRIIYSNDGLIYYTEDHYKSFEQLY